MQGLAAQKHMEELESLPSIGKGKNVPWREKSIAAGKLVLQRIPSRVDKKRLIASQSFRVPETLWAC